MLSSRPFFDGWAVVLPCQSSGCSEIWLARNFPMGFKVFMAQKTIYRVIYVNEDEIYELYASKVYNSELYGFIEIETWLFGERSQLLVDPSEEKLKNEFAGVSRSYIPMTSIIRIDEVEQQGQAKVSNAKGGTVASFPRPPVKTDK